jgi:DMSO/TMAO reductase YedYZ molybdopterin-dependent catalytic subunit
MVHGPGTRLRALAARLWTSLRLDRLWRGRALWLQLLLAGLAAGTVATLAATMAMAALRLWWGTPAPPELLGELILPHLTAQQFVALLISYQPHPKTGPLAQALLGQSALGVLVVVAFTLGVLHRAPRTRWPGWRALAAAGILALAMTLVAVALFWPVLPEGLVGDPIERARWLTTLALLISFATYAGVLVLAGHWLRLAWVGVPSSPDPAPRAGTQTPIRTGTASVTRRQALVAGGVVVLAASAGVLALRDLLQAYLARSAVYDGLSTPSPNGNPITPTGEFYVVTKNVLDPVVATDRWQLEITGLVAQPRVWTYEQVRALPSETRAITLECISNDVGGHLISTAVWKGITLDRLLALAGGARPAGRYVVFTSADGYQTSLSLADLLQARALLAWEMNGQPLPQRHGFPLRVVVPGRYGEQSAKWLTRVEMVQAPFKGFYQSQGWSDAPVPTFSRIDAPPGSVAPGMVTVAGVAYAGIRGIQRVQISADGGATWQDAMLQQPVSDQSWVLWTWAWTPPAKGRYTLVVRATDGTGAVQTSTRRGTVPDGATGWDSVQVVVR